MGEPEQEKAVAELTNENWLMRAAVGNYDAKSLQEEVERRVVLSDTIVMSALKCTKKGGWTNLGGKPYLNGYGAEMVRRLFGISLSEPVVVEHLEPEPDEFGRWYWFEAKLTASHPMLGTLTTVGTCSCRDEFLGMKGLWEGEGEARKKRLVPKEQVDKGAILKAALTNAEVNAITRLVGIRGLGWPDLAPYDITADGVAKVDYQQGAKGGQADTRYITEPQVRRLAAICHEHKISDEAIKTYLTNNAARFGMTPDKISRTLIRRSDYDTICKWAENDGMPEFGVES